MPRKTIPLDDRVIVVNGECRMVLTHREHVRRNAKPRAARRFDRRAARQPPPKPPEETKGQRAEREALEEVRRLAAIRPA
jgi:hypothetical protein